MEGTGINVLKYRTTEITTSEQQREKRWVGGGE